ncbi:MAG: bifunctional homocysteine S-methyltransferase/methylenetetrahydrofolate reductase, partial [Candidatus Firestonebacteria bacterium]|nr:bifunctional homocysteine S-methyltransferase/methylenetetrahydrofolate reductase [Candidatus Firestonebacteria bacterium]
AAYVRAGCDVIETNTFGANGYKLKKFGLDGQLESINSSAVQLARQVAGEKVLVAGAVGPLGAFLKPLGPVTPEEAADYFKRQIRCLVQGGVDLLVFETFADIKELEAAVTQARALTDLPIIVQASFNEKGETQIGTKVETFVREASCWDVDVIGFNCSTGPADMLTWLETAVRLTAKPISCQPNAGMPRTVEGRNFYMATSEYLAEYAKRFIQTGAHVIGGCCGTTPEHIKAMRAAIRALFPARPNTVAEVCEPGESLPAELPMAEKSAWGRKLSAREFVTSVEITPPRSADPAATLEKCRALKAAGVDAVNIPDGPRASARLSPLVIAILIEQQVGIETVLHYACRDRNIIGMQSDLLGAYAAGLRNLLIITGDPPKMGDYPEATAVFDVDSIGLTRIVRRLNRGRDVGGNPIPLPLSFVKGVGVNPGAINLEQEIERLRQKIDAGAEYAITQPVFDTEVFKRFREKIQDLAIPVIAGVWPLVSFKNAEFMNNEVPGASVPASLMARMQAKGSGPEAQAEGVAIAGEALRSIRPWIDGVQVSAPLGKVEIALAVLRAGKSL